MASYSEIVWEPEISELQERIIEYGDETVEAIAALVSEHAEMAEAQMKAQAPWTDRTGRARRELRADVIHEGTTVSMQLVHGAPYGIWLEVRWGGRYAIIGPVSAEAGERLMGALRQALRT